MKLIVCGGRDFKDWGLLHDTLASIHEGGQITHLIHGGARGADALAGAFAKTYMIQEVICPANWKHGKSGGVLRNKAMLELKPDLVVAFPGGRGTQDMVTRAINANVEVRLYSYAETEPNGNSL